MKKTLGCVTAIAAIVGACDTEPTAEGSIGVGSESASDSGASFGDDNEPDGAASPSSAPIGSASPAPDGGVSAAPPSATPPSAAPPSATNSSTATACQTWAEGTDSEDDGATRDFYNAGVRLRWRNYLGDWLDANGLEQGEVPYATATLVDDDVPDVTSLDVTALVRRWVNEGSVNRGFFLRGLSGGSFRFGTRENVDARVRPRLRIVTSQAEETRNASADTYLRASTYQSAGQEDGMTVGEDEPALVHFNLDGVVGAVDSAILEVTSVAEFGGRIELGVFEAAPGMLNALPAASMGLAADFADDEGIESADAVIFAEGFEREDWGGRWSSGVNDSTVALVAAESGFESLSGFALKVTVPMGENAGLSLRYNFLEAIGEEPDAIYLRYYLRFAESWRPSFGGKLPGTAGTYGVAGWGGRPVDGTDGWSARGQYELTAPAGNPFENHIPIGNYVYHADMQEQFGDTELYGCGGVLAQNRWYAVEQYIQLNTPGQTDGIIRAWVDGRLVEEKTDWRWRDVSSLHIENVWMNVYHGGTAKAPQDLVLYIDNVVIAREYIGPMRQL